MKKFSDREEELIASGNDFDRKLYTIDPRDRACPAYSSPGWYWAIGPNQRTIEGHTLIQLTRGPDTELQPGITHEIDPKAWLRFATLSPGVMFRSE
ncbi:hypothetical protein TWF696_003649 [Orbilia brochopaga]|uniref:Uncharacterized protein n=1 Tax=Orbilia brochopaga TaxID=3140254 RepID=A0AAV9V3Q7_9PEZI